ncbi:MAG: pyridoxal phosphate-dependent aminotransferase [Chloroflexota bacterium]
MTTKRREALRMAGVPFSDIRVIFERATYLEKEGVPVIHMELGRPDFDTPPHVKIAAERALEQGLVHYTSNYGLLELRQAVARKLQRDNGLDYDPDGEIAVTVGVSEAIFSIMSAFLDQGDEVIVPGPSWLNYLRIPAMMGAQVVPLPLPAENGFQLEPEMLEKAITPLTKMLVLISPHNPTGAVLQKKTLESVAALVQQHDILVVSDEIYEKIIYDGQEHVSIAALPGMKERTFLLNGFSKAYSMTGWRLGYVATDRELMGPLIRVHQYVTACATSFAQAGGVQALNGPQDCVAQMVAEFQRRRNLVVNALNRMPGLACHMPQGAFYAFADISAFGLSGPELALYLLEKGGVAVVPGEAFGDHGRGYLRISYANSYDQLSEGLERMGRALARLSPTGRAWQR